MQSWRSSPRRAKSALVSLPVSAAASTAAVRILAVNAGRAVRTADGRRALRAVLGAHERRWGMVLVSECDGAPTTSLSPALEGASIHRHWPGEGSVAMAWWILSRFAPQVRRVAWRCRCGLAHCAMATRAGQAAHLAVVGVHGPHDDAMRQECLTDMIQLVRNCQRSARVVLAGDWTVAARSAHSAGPGGAGTERSRNRALVCVGCFPWRATQTRRAGRATACCRTCGGP